MNSIWTNIGHPAGFGSIQALSKAAKTRFQSTKKYLQSQDAYTLTKSHNRRFPRRQFIALAVNELVLTDLADVSQLSRYNKGVKFTLILQCCLSKRVYYMHLKIKLQRR